MTYLIQNISLRRDKFSKGEAYAWIRSHGYDITKPAHVSPHFYQFRQVDPARLHGARFRTIDLGDKGHLTTVYF